VAGALRGRLVGLLTGAILSIVNVATRGFLDADMARDAVLLIGLGFLIGQVAVTTRQAVERLRRALLLEAATAERERLARSIHDGVLQVLARVSRRGSELGGEDAELGRLAAEQEHALRALVAVAPNGDLPGDLIDLGMLLTLQARPNVQVSVPAPAVLLPARVANEINAAVHEAVSNADIHAGPQARVWVLLEDLGETVTVSIRDDGSGIPDGRLDAAYAQGRMGVAKSMRGRVLDLGGAIELKSEPGMGTEWDIKVPPPTGRARQTVIAMCGPS
jgi:signal transduction histidine kinase